MLVGHCTGGVGSDYTASLPLVHILMWPFYYILESESPSVVSDSFDPSEPIRVLCLRDSPGQNTGVGSHSLSPGDLLDPGIEPESPELQTDSSPSEPSGKPRSSSV